MSDLESLVIQLDGMASELGDGFFITTAGQSQAILNESASALRFQKELIEANHSLKAERDALAARVQELEMTAHRFDGPEAFLAADPDNRSEP